jgi:hypothetical protein
MGFRWTETSRRPAGHSLRGYRGAAQSAVILRLRHLLALTDTPSPGWIAASLERKSGSRPPPNRVRVGWVLVPLGSDSLHPRSLVRSSKDPQTARRCDRKRLADKVPLLVAMYKYSLVHRYPGTAKGQLSLDLFRDPFEGLVEDPPPTCARFPLFATALDARLLPLSFPLFIILYLV